MNKIDRSAALVPAVGAQVERGVGPCAYRLRDAEAQSWLYYSDDELHDAAKAALSPLYDQAALAAVRDRCEKLRAFVQEVADHAFEHHQVYWAIRANEVLGPNVEFSGRTRSAGTQG